MDTPEKASALFHQGDYNAARIIYERLDSLRDDNRRGNFSMNIACCYAAAGDLAKAWSILDKIDSNSSDLLYNKSACAYLLGNYGEAKILIEKLLNKMDQTIFEPSLANRDQQSRMIEPGLVEALNLKAAILFKLDQEYLHEALCCLYAIPIKGEENYDCVTLHNLAIYELCLDLDGSLDKLRHLNALDRDRSLSSFVPKQTSWNLTLALLQAGNFNQAGQILAAKEVEIRKIIPSGLIDYVKLVCQYPEDERDLCGGLEKLLDVTLEKKASGSDADDSMDELIDIIVGKLTRTLWNAHQYSDIVDLLMKVKPHLGNSKDWKQNMAHALFMQDTRFSDALLLYEELLSDEGEESLLNVHPMVISNLCVSYIMTGRNGDAEQLIKEIEIEELRRPQDSNSNIGSVDSESNLLPNPTTICITNLVIGTLYSVKSNYEFGLSRLFKGLESVEKKLCPRSWFHAKRCLLALLDGHCKQTVYLKDELFDRIVSFLMECEKHGHNISPDPLSVQYLTSLPSPSIADQAKYLRSMFLEAIHE